MDHPCAGYSPWANLREHAAPTTRDAIDRIEADVRRNYAQESSSAEITLDTLQDMRRDTWARLKKGQDCGEIDRSQRLYWMRDPDNPKRAILYA